MLLEITQALTSLKSIGDLTSLILKTTVDSTVTQKAIELHSAIISLQTAMLSIQTQNQELLTENDQLKKELMAVKNWETEATKYHLAQIYPGTFVYAIKPDELSAQPSHWLCAKCYEGKQKSILQRGTSSGSGRNYHCFTCKTSVIGPADPAKPVT